MSKVKAERCQKLLQVFHEGLEFYQAKDLEKPAKEKGIPAKLIPELLKALVEEDLIDSDKIGSSVFYWSFPNKIRKVKSQQLEQLNAKKQELHDKVTKLEAKLESQKVRDLSRKAPTDSFI